MIELLINFILPHISLLSFGAFGGFVAWYFNKFINKNRSAIRESLAFNLLVLVLFGAVFVLALITSGVTLVPLTAIENGAVASIILGRMTHDTEAMGITN